MPLREFAQPRGCLDGKALHQPLAVYVRIEKRADMGLKLRNRRVGRELDLRLPAFHGDAAVFRIDAGNDMLSAHAVGEFRGEPNIDFALFGEERGADDDALCTRIEHLPCAVDGVDAAAGLDWQPLCNLRDKF